MRRFTRRASLHADTEWWREATFYQVYVRSFVDSDGDGIGDLTGITSRLGYLELLGVDALWITAFYRSPMADHGYDVSDPRDVDPTFGDLATFDELVHSAHEHGIRVTVDLVPNHTSSEHPWFTQALDSTAGSVERSRYIFRDSLDGNPPNNWLSVFGGPAWTQVPDGQWYLHLLDPTQPDLNWDNTEVRADLEKTIRFWLDRGVDGFRIDLAHGNAKPIGLPDMDPLAGDGGLLTHSLADPRFDDDDVHEIHRGIRSVLDEYHGVMAVGDIWVRDDHRFARYLRPDELHLGFNFRLALAQFDADEVRLAIEHSLEAAGSVGAPATWTLSNHDIEREVTRYGDGEQGLYRARAMALVEFALPGTVFIYNGAELGLPSVDLPDWALRDPQWQRSGRIERGRDGARIPIPWEGENASYGFSTTTDTWLPMPNEWARLRVEAQLEDPESMLSLYRHAVQLRREHPSFRGTELEWYGAPVGCFAFRRKGGGLTCALNTSAAPVAVPPGTVLLASRPMDDGLLPPDSAVWLIP